MTNFILGGLFLYILLPILESILGAICTRIEQYKAKCGVKIAEYNNKITQLNMGVEQESARQPIGFCTSIDEDDEEEYEED